MTGYGTIYQFEFDGTCNPFGTLLTTKCKVLILKKDYSGSITTIPYGQTTPVEIDYPTADDDIFYPLKGSSLTFKVLGGVINMDSIISENERDFIIEYYRDTVLFWRGFVSAELCEEDIFLKYPAIEFKTIDGLGTLKDKKLQIGGKRPPGILTILQLIQGLLNDIGYEYGLNALLKLWYTSHSKTAYSTPLEQTYIFTNSLKDNNFELKDNLTLLVDMCNVLNVFIYQNYGSWFVVKPKDLTFGVNGASKFSIDGVLNTSSKATIPTLVHGTNFLIVAEPKRKIRRYYKEVEIQYQYGTNKLINGDFSMWVGIINEYPFTTGANHYKYINTAGLTFVSENNNQTLFYSAIKLATPPDNSARSFLVYDTPSDKYYMAITAPVITFGYYMRSVEIHDPESFTFTLDCPTGNPRFSLRAIAVLPIVGAQTKYWNFEDNAWQNTEYVFTRSVNYPNQELLTLNYTIDRPDFYVDPKEGEFYSVGITLYPQGRTGFTGYESWYSNLLIYGNKTPKSPDKETVRIENIKDASIIPEKKVVYNGDGFYNATPTLISDSSNFKVLSGTDYVSTAWPVTSGTTETGGWQERDEEDRYALNELYARNVLNQYSDYRNIFTGTLIGKGLQYGAIYEFPMQGALNSKKFWPLSIKMNERDCTAEIILMELSSNEITGKMTVSRYDTSGALLTADFTESKKKLRNGVGTDLGEAGDSGTIFDRFVAFFMDDFNA
jgi:hypothetical protein